MHGRINGWINRWMSIWQMLQNIAASMMLVCCCSRSSIKHGPWWPAWDFKAPVIKFVSSYDSSTWYHLAMFNDHQSRQFSQETLVAEWWNGHDMMKWSPFERSLHSIQFVHFHLRFDSSNSFVHCFQRSTDLSFNDHKTNRQPTFLSFPHSNSIRKQNRKRKKNEDIT